MKNQFALFLIIVLSFKVAYSQTNVSGGIYSNTTWTKANSPYIVTDTIVVFPGVTLTIQPGVVVKFDNTFYIEFNQSKLVAEGTSTDSITFTSNDVSPTQGSWGNLYFYDNLVSKFNYCNFRYANYAILTASIYDTIVIKNSSFKYNNYGIYPDDIYTAPCIIDSCSFINNTYGINIGQDLQMSNSNVTNNTYGVFFYDNSTVKKCNITNNSQYGISIYNNDSVLNCSINGNGIGLICGSGPPTSLVYGSIIENNNIGVNITWYEVTMHCNKICSNTTYNLECTHNAFGGDVTGNYWCSTDSAIIKSTIYDGYDNINYAIVPFMPIDTTQCYLATGTGQELKSSIDIQVYPNPTSASFIVKSPYGGKQLLQVFDITGKLRSTYNLQYGDNIIAADGLSPGVYNLCLTLGEDRINKKLVIIK